MPLWLKVGYTAMAAVVAAVYARKYPLGNFLWFSDIALLVLVPALWLESAFLASMMAVGVLLPELFWNVGFFTRLATGAKLSGLTDYMFDPRTPRWLRALSLFHVVVPIVLVWMLARLGYVPSAWKAQTLLAWVVAPVCYRFTDPAENTNWVHSLGRLYRELPPLLALFLTMLAFPLLIYLPTHFLLSRLF